MEMAELQSDATVLANKHKINLTSLNVVREELIITIEQAATQLEGFVSDRHNEKLLNSCIDSLQQIRGSLDLIELHGAKELAGEILDSARKLNDLSGSLADEKLSALTKGFFVLSCYFEYALQKEYGLPALMVPYINDIRIAFREPIIWESHFADAITTFRLEADSKELSTEKHEDIVSVSKRYRHMYQVGLLGLIRETRIQPSLQLMQRASDKIAGYAKGTQAETFWWLLSRSLEAMALAEMEPSAERKRLFSRMDREFKRLETQGYDGFKEDVSSDYLKELSYYVAIADIKDEPFQKIKVGFGYSNLGYTENLRISELRSLTGPSASAVSSVAETLKMELRSAKEVMEYAAENENSMIDNFQEFIISLSKIRDILDVVGLKSASQTMKQQIETIKEWEDSSEKADTLAIMDVADAFLYIESVLDSIEKRNFSDEKLAEINKLSRNQMIVTSHLADAQLVVLDEAEAGLIMVKRALSSFAESSYDRVHINNVTKTMNTVRGAMIVLNLQRAAAIVVSCNQFIEGALLSNSQPAALEHMLDTFADAIMCLEYYLDCLKVDKNISSDTLIIAEESLAALGYGVAFSG